MTSENLSAVERAFELARSGQVKTVDEIRKRLAREGRDQDQIFGRELSRQLNDAIRQAKQQKGDPPAC